MNQLPSSAKKKKVALVPLEEELAHSYRRREVTDQLLEARSGVNVLLHCGQLDRDQSAALEKFRRAVEAGISVVKTFRA